MKIMTTGSRAFCHLDNEKQIQLIKDLKSELLEYKKQYNDLSVIVGMAEGWDEEVAKAAIALNIPFHAYVPNSTYPIYYWRLHSEYHKDRLSQYNEIISKAESVLYVCGEQVYQNGIHSNLVRNNKMVDDCNIAFVYYDNKSVGTKYTLRALDKQNKRKVFFT